MLIYVFTCHCRLRLDTKLAEPKKGSPQENGEVDEDEQSEKDEEKSEKNEEENYSEIKMNDKTKDKDVKNESDDGNDNLIVKSDEKTVGKEEKEDKKDKTEESKVSCKKSDLKEKCTENDRKSPSLSEDNKHVDLKNDSFSSSSSSSQKEKKETDNGKSSDSDKENMEDGPIDLSTPIDLSKQAGASPDVITLSDEDDDTPKMNGPIDHLNGELTGDRIKDRKRIIRRLQEELRNEEAKLVLLKKIRQSQLMQHIQESQPSKTVPPSQNRHAAPPPLVRGSSSQSLKPPSNEMKGSSRPSITSHMRTQNQGPPPLVMAPRQNSIDRLSHSSARGMHHVASAPQLSNYSGRQGQSQSQSQVPEQTPAQRQAAAKLALRKQLEKTLLQIPPPKPPPPEMNFIPNLVGNEFIMLVGLEEVVKHITDNDRKEGKPADVKYVFNPFTCIQCGTDSTPVWKRDKPGSKCVICEACVTSNQKKALKQEHTNRLKSAFVKALQQEQEIEQRMQQQQQQHQQQQEQQRQQQQQQQQKEDRERERQKEREREKLAEQQRQQLTLALNAHHALTSMTRASPMNLTTNVRPTAEQLRQHQNLLQAHQAQLRGNPLGLQLNPRAMPFPFQPAITKADLQRQYLLDMIPPRSMPGGTVLWKTWSPPNV